MTAPSGRRRLRTALAIAVVLGGSFPVWGVAQPGATDRLMAASAAAEAADWDAVVRDATMVVNDPQRSIGDRAEANRLLGLAAYYQERHAAAEAHFLAYLRQDLDGRLDPSLYPPELVGFFETVRSTHAAELRALRPRLRPRRTALLNFLPPAGQFQNQEPGKGWMIAGLGAGFLITNLVTYAVLVRWCDQPDRTCENDGESRSDAARTVAAVNRWSGIAAIVTYGYGVIDGFRHHRRTSSATSGVMISAWPSAGGVGVGLHGGF